MIARIRAGITHDTPVIPGMAFVVLMYSLPNLLPAFWPRMDTHEAEVFFMGIGLILLPCVFSVPVRGALLFWLPAAALVPAALVYNIVSGSPLREWAFVVLTETSWQELTRFWSAALVGLILAPFAVWLLAHFIFRHIPRGHRLSWPGRIAVILLALITPVNYFARGGENFGAMLTERKLSAIFPPGLAVSAWSAGDIRRHIAGRAGLGSSVHVTSVPTGHREIYVLVIGESARFSSFQINGYPRETTPLLAKTKGLLSFQDVAAPATVTLMSVPVLLTPSTAESLLEAPARPSVLSVFRRAGFYTAWYSTQKKHGMYDTVCSMFSNDAHESRFLSGIFAPGTGSYQTAFDCELLPLVRELLARNLPKTFIVLHTMGSHQHYCDRFPPDRNWFKCRFLRPLGGILSGKFSDEEKRDLTDAYNNSIRYTDYVLSQLIETLAATHAVSALYYVSDHGQNGGDAKRLPFAHGAMTRDVIQVPLLMWLSPEYRAQWPEKTAALESHVNTPFSSDTTFHTLTDMAGLSCPLLRLEESAASASFAPGRRMVRDLQGNVIDYAGIESAANP